MSKEPYLSIIIPAYNEEKRLPYTLIDINKYLSLESYAYEILVVNDGSTDNTVEEVKKLYSIVGNLRIIDNKVNRGKGTAVKQGMLEAKGKFRIFMDADNSTSIDQFEKMIPYLNEGFDVVIGSRAVKGAKLSPPPSLRRMILGRLGNLIIRLFLLPNIRDTQCGFKCFSAEAAFNIFRLQKISDWGFDIEILALAKAFKYKIKKIPVTWKDSFGSKVKWSAYINVLIEVFKVRYWLWNNSYAVFNNNKS